MTLNLAFDRIPAAMVMMISGPAFTLEWFAALATVGGLIGFVITMVAIIAPLLDEKSSISIGALLFGIGLTFGAGLVEFGIWIHRHPIAVIAMIPLGVLVYAVVIYTAEYRRVTTQRDYY